MMAARDDLEITVHGRQTHGALPWERRRPDRGRVADRAGPADDRQPPDRPHARRRPSSRSASSSGGNRTNIIPEEVKMTGTIRTFDPAMRHDIHERIKRTAENIAEAAGATATVNIENRQRRSPTTIRRSRERMGPTLKRVAGDEPRGTRAAASRPRPKTSPTTSRRCPGCSSSSASRPRAPTRRPWPRTTRRASSPTRPRLPVGVRALANLAVDYLAVASTPRRAVGIDSGAEIGAGNGIRTRDFDLGKVALYH